MKRTALVVGLMLVVLGIGDSRSSGYRLVSIQEVREAGEICFPNVMALLRATSAYAAQESGQTIDITRQPVRRLWDTDPSYGSIAFDNRTGKVFLQDLNLWAIRIFDRMTNTPANAPRSEPERVIQGKETELQFNTCMYIDTKNGDIYTVEACTMVAVFVAARLNWAACHAAPVQ